MFQHVIEIPQTQENHPIWDQQLRVAAYCRTSTNQEEQNSSLENQIAYYTAFIQSDAVQVSHRQVLCQHHRVDGRPAVLAAVQFSVS